MKKQDNKTNNETRGAETLLCKGFFIARQYWIGLTFVALFGLAVAAPAAEAAPMDQRTVPTPTPQSFDPPPEDNNNNDSADEELLELFATPTPEPTIEPDSDNGDDGFASGGGSGSNVDNNDDSNNDRQDELFEDAPVDDEIDIFDNVDPLAEDEFPLDDFIDEDDTFEGIVDVSFLNMFSGPDQNSGIIDTLFSDTPIQILGRNEIGDWVHICCGDDRGNQGWVPASDIDFGFDFDNPEGELPVFDEDLTPIDENTLAEEPLSVTPGLEQELAELEFSMSVDSNNILPGDEIELLFWVTNASDIDATDVSLRNELPDILEFESAVSIDGTLTETTNPRNNDAPVFRIDWPELAAGETATATVSIQVSNNADYGLVVDNLAGVVAANAEIKTAGVTIGTPPPLPPDFLFSRQFR